MRLSPPIAYTKPVIQQNPAFGMPLKVTWGDNIAPETPAALHDAITASEKLTAKPTHDGVVLTHQAKPPDDEAHLKQAWEALQAQHADLANCSTDYKPFY